MIGLRRKFHESVFRTQEDSSETVFSCLTRDLEMDRQFRQ